MRRDLDVTSTVTIHIGEILYNSIVLNELNPKYSDDSDYGYVLYGIAKNSDGHKILVRSTINVYSMEFEGTEEYYTENLKAINAKKESDVAKPPRVISPFSDSIITISSLLD